MKYSVHNVGVLDLAPVKDVRLRVFTAKQCHADCQWPTQDLIFGNKFN